MIANNQYVGSYDLGSYDPGFYSPMPYSPMPYGPMPNGLPTVNSTIKRNFKQEGLLSI
jgi:hypothetical protein